MKTREPPYTERYVRWCGRSVDKIIICLLPDLKKGDCENMKLYKYIILIMSVLVLKHIEQYISNNVVTNIKTIIELLIITSEVILKYPLIAIHLRIYNSKKKSKCIETILYILKVLNNII